MIHTHVWSRISGVVCLLLIGVVLRAPSVAADAAYPTQQLPLFAVGDAPLRSGYVVNEHFDGEVYGREEYVLKGAARNTTYLVQAQFYYADATCAGTPGLNGPFATLETNGGGNAKAEMLIYDAQVPSFLRGNAHGLIWQITDQQGTVMYQTGCARVFLD